MARVYDFEERLKTVKNISENADDWRAAAEAASYFARAVDALQVEFQPENLSSDANKYFFSLIRDYYLEAADDIQEFCPKDDDNTID